LLGDLGQDLRYGIRGLRRAPSSTLLIVLSLALGIGANAAIFSVLQALLWRQLPVRDPGGLVFLTDGLGSGRSTRLLARQGRLLAYSYPLYRDLRGDRSFSGLAAEDSMEDTALVGGRGSDRPAPGSAIAVSGNYFEVLGVPAALGRTFTAEDETAAGANPVVVLGHGYWVRRFGGDPSVLGARLTVNGRPYTVVGVAAPGFAGTKVGETADLWVPLTMHAALHKEDRMIDRPDRYWLHPIGRLAAGASERAATASLNLTLAQHLRSIQGQLTQSENAEVAAGQVRIQLTDAARGASRLRETFRPALLSLQAGVALLLLIVCLNVSHLLLARATRRQREMSIRTALGASRARLVRQLLTEGLVLAALGLAGAALLTRWLVEGLLVLSLGGGTGRALAVPMDARVRAFSAALALATAVILGLVPAWQASRADLRGALHASSRAVTGAGRRALVSRLLLSSQVALSLVLLVSAGLFAGTLRSLRQVDRGFQVEHLLLAELDFRFVQLTDQQLEPLYDDLVRRVSALPGAASASLSMNEILGGGRWTSRISFGSDPRGAVYLPHVFVVSPTYFQTVGMTLLRGRGFERGDRGNTPRVAIINETLARQLPGGEALGRRFRFGDPSSSEPPATEVVGILRDAKINNLREAPRPTVYLPLAQSLDVGVGNLQVRTRTDPAALANQVRRVAAEVHPDLLLADVRTMATALDRSLRQERLLATLSSAFGLVALFLVCLGLYGVIAQWAAQRTQEIGVRMALGATRGTVQWLVLRQAFVLVLAGVVIGVPAAAAAARVIAGLLYGVQPFHPLTLTASGLMLFAVAALAAYLPARRASRADPMLALRSE
jgi:predicted permease